LRADLAKAVFLDRDGTLIQERNYLSSPEQVSLLPYCSQALRILADAGYHLILITNQSGIARGYFTMDDFLRVQERFQSLLAKDGIQLDASFVCPHHPEAPILEYRLSCDCRKPRPGLLDRAAKELSLDLKQSWIIGDKADDIRLSVSRPLKPLLVRSGHGSEQEEELLREFPSLAVADDIMEAARIIVARETQDEASP
jgi:D-glycero-D-manno-heptose 1,7-bisphosphate phosphatase